MAEDERSIRRKDRAVTDPAVIQRVLRYAMVCRVAMVDGTVPYLVPMNCGWDGGELFLHSAAEGRKLEILRANPRVCVEFEEEVRIVTAPTGSDCTSCYRTVLGMGTARFVADPAEKGRALNVIIRQCHPGMPDEVFPAEVLDRVTVLAVRFDRLTCKANLPAREKGAS